MLGVGSIVSILCSKGRQRLFSLGYSEVYHIWMLEWFVSNIISECVVIYTKCFDVKVDLGSVLTQQSYSL